MANDNDRRKFQGCRTPTVEHYEDEGMFTATWFMTRTNIEATYPRWVRGKWVRRKLQWQRWVWYQGKVITSQFGIVPAAGYVWCESGDAQFESAPVLVP